MNAPASEKLRVDKWLWQARFCKTRSLSAALVSAGHVRLNGTKLHKPAQTIGPGDVLTFVQGQQVRVIRVEALGSRRGPASEAQTLYTDLEPPEARTEPPANHPGAQAKGRPTGRDRRGMQVSRLTDLE